MPRVTKDVSAPLLAMSRGEDFRTVGADRTTAANAEVDALVRDLRQRLVRTVLEDDEDTQPLAFIGSARVADGVAALVRAIEQQLGLTRTAYRQGFVALIVCAIHRRQHGDRPRAHRLPIAPKNQRFRCLDVGLALKHGFLSGAGLHLQQREPLLYLAQEVSLRNRQDYQEAVALLRLGHRHW